MACQRPLYATQNASGEVELCENRTEALYGDGEYLEIACRNCESCRATRARSWAIRCYHESQMHTRAVNNNPKMRIPNGCFITLTYDDSHLPSSGSLDHRDFQNFAKKIRRDLGKFRYLMCGEYGAKTLRPHYHACLFGLDFHEDREVWRQTSEDHIEWISETLSSTWAKGHAALAPLNYATAAYTAGYVVKKLKSSLWREATTVYGSGPDPVSSMKPEYIAMSRNPGLGTEWFKLHWKDIYPADRVSCGGKMFRPPKFYDELLRKSQPRVYEEVMRKRHQHYEELGPTSDLELKARGANFRARYAQKNQRDPH